MASEKTASVVGGVSNTPPVTTNHNNQPLNLDGLNACVDWFSCSFNNETTLDTIFQLLKLDKSLFEFRDYGEFGYTNRCSYMGIIKILYTPSEEFGNNGLHLDITGQGCRYLESTWNERTNWTDFLNILEYFGYKQTTRIDLAIDDFRGMLNIKELWQKWKDGEVSTRIRQWRYFESGETYKNGVVGETFYCGSPKRTQFRFYNKLQERQNKGFAVNDSVKCWNRYEIQVRHEQASKLTDEIKKGGQDVGKLAKSLFKQYICFKERNGSDGCRHRWKTSDFWNEFVGSVEPLRLRMEFPEHTLIDKRKWLIDTISPTIAMLAEYSENEEDFIKDLLTIGKTKLTNQHRKKIDFQKLIDKTRDKKLTKIYELNNKTSDKNDVTLTSYNI